MAGPLAGLRVLDFSRLMPGPFATMVLADLGADVVRVESPVHEDFVRTAPPFDGETSVLHGWLGRSKRSIAIDVKQPEGRRLIHRLLDDYDVLVEGFRPGVMERLELDGNRLRRIQPRLIYVSISGYGQTGPWRERAAHDVNVLAAAGWLGHSGSRRSGPARLGVQPADLGGGMGALVGLLAAVVHRTATGEGQTVDVGMYDMAVAANALALGNWLAAGRVADYETEMLNGATFYDHYETSDGRHLSVGSLEPHFWERLCAVLDLPDLRGRLDEALGGSVEIKRRLAERIRGCTLEHWQSAFAAEDACVEPVLRVDEVASHPQFEARRLAVDVPRGDGTVQRQVASPWQFSATSTRYAHTGSRRGAHTDEVLDAAGIDATRRESLRRRGIIA